jgi:hypothetical protein
MLTCVVCKRIVRPNEATDCERCTPGFIPSYSVTEAYWAFLLRDTGWTKFYYNLKCAGPTEDESGRRPDFFFFPEDVPGQKCAVVIEIDEYEHKYRDRADELSRMRAITEAVKAPRIVFIRINPTTFSLPCEAGGTKKHHIEVSTADKLCALDHVLKQVPMLDFTTEDVHIAYLFYHRTLNMPYRTIWSTYAAEEFRHGGVIGRKRKADIQSKRNYEPCCPLRANRSKSFFTDEPKFVFIRKCDD